MLTSVRRSPFTRAAAEAVAVTAGVAGLGRVIVGPLCGLPADDGVNRWLQAHRTPVLDRVTWALSTYSDTVPTILTAGVLLVRGRRRGSTLAEAGRPLAAIALETAVFMTAAAWVGRPRPSVEWLDRPAPTSSFPSGHTGATTALHRTLADLLDEARAPRALAGGLRWCWPPLVAWSRLYRGMHHPSDVVVGMAVGTWSHATVRRVLAVR